ncbi:MAG TPA: hypothetical protein VF228_07350 [Iamia sp.]
MKIVLALLAGAALGVAATRLRSGATAPAVTAGPDDPGPDRVAVDVSAFGD